MIHINYEHITSTLIDVFKNVSQDILHIYNSEFAVMYKANQSPVTHADIMAEEKITEAIQNITPDITIYGEETFTYQKDITQDTFWLLDPIDGTRAFINKENLWTINAGLIHNGKPVFGLVYSPLTDEMYSGSPIGVFKNGMPIQTRSYDNTITVACSFIPKPQTKTHDFLQDYTINEILELTSSIKMCRIAEGCADIYPRFGPTYEWDTAAANAILHYAGGSIKTVNGDILHYGKPYLKNPEFISYGKK